LDYQYTLTKTKGKRRIIGLFWGSASGGGEWAQGKGHKEWSEYGGCISYSYTKIKE
jgi:hypothetical protein